MGYFQLQERLGLFETVHFSSRRVSKNQSSLVMGIIILVHAVIILLVLNVKIRQREYAPEKNLHMITVLSKPVELIPEPDKPNVPEPRSWQLVVPQIQFSEPTQSQLDTPLNDSSYELPSEASNQYQNVFDPKLRKKLIDAQSLNVPRKQAKSKNWTEADGRTFVDIGDGMCLVSMPIVDSRQRGTNWGMARCGKTDSEKMMDSVNADLEARKHPLKIQ